jgi:hypothetical protein
MSVKVKVTPFKLRRLQNGSPQPTERERRQQETEVWLGLTLFAFIDRGRSKSKRKEKVLSRTEFGCLVMSCLSFPGLALPGTLLSGKVQGFTMRMSMADNDDVGVVRVLGCSRLRFRGTRLENNSRRVSVSVSIPLL